MGELQSSTDELYIPKESFETLKAELEEEKVRIDTVSREIDDVPDLIENAIDPKIDACQKSYKILKKAVQHERERVTYLIPKVHAVPNLIETTVNPKIEGVQGKLNSEASRLRGEIAASASTEKLLVLGRKYVEKVGAQPANSKIGLVKNPGDDYQIELFVDPPAADFNKDSGTFTATFSGVFRVEISFEITNADGGVRFNMEVQENVSKPPKTLLDIASSSTSMNDHVERYVSLDGSAKLSF